VEGTPVPEASAYLQGTRILIIDDDPAMAGLIGHCFSGTGTQIYSALDGREGLRQLYLHRPHLVILDIMMPEVDGWQVCSRIRQVSDVPVIILSALDGENNIIRGLDGGAVDYVTKPFSPKVLVARVHAALRQAELKADAEKLLVYGDEHLTVNLGQRQVLVRGVPVDLTRIEYRLLAYLVEHAGQVLTHQQILGHVWGPEYGNSSEYVHVHISHLRQKLEKDPLHPQYLVTKHGVGYSFRLLPPE
jgi:two-component system KDP operon response regulator KdpE